MPDMIIAVDFDGTVVDHRFPEIGPDAPGAVQTLLDLVAAGHKLIIWTMRSEDTLDDAAKWYRDRGIEVWGVNENPDQDWSSSPKAFANAYIDDLGVGCPLLTRPGFKRPVVDWSAVRRTLVARGILP